MQSERLLLKTYNIKLPDYPTLGTPPGRRDAAATGVLQMLHPILGSDHVPLSVIGDGNCLFRALSRGLYGHENHHQHIRLLTAMEIMSQRFL